MVVEIWYNGRNYAYNVLIMLHMIGHGGGKVFLVSMFCFKSG